MIAETIIEEVVAAVLEQGSLTKEQLLETWSIPAGDYEDVQRAVLDRHDYIRKGPPRVGGLRVRRRKGKRPGDGEADEFCWENEWERETVARLGELLQHSELEELLGDLRETVRQTRKEQTGVDRRGAKPELATALLLIHGIDLFFDPAVRKEVGKAAGVKAPKKWHPGKDGAIRFVKAAGFPGVLAGIPTEDAKPDYETLEGRFNILPLEGFQTEVKLGLLKTLGTPGDRAIVTLPTGAGKTRVAVESIKEWLTSRFDTVTKRASDAAIVLWLAHTEELCEQAYACFKQVWEGSDNVCPLLLVRFWSRYTQDLSKHRKMLEETQIVPSVLISTPQRIINLLDGRIQGSDAVVEGLRGALGLLLVDEAHRAAAPSYRRILKDLLAPDRPISVAGLTATPFRMEYLGQDEKEGTRELREIFTKLIEPETTLGDSPRQKLQEMGVLATPVFETIETPTTLQMPTPLEVEAASDEELERIDRALAVRADNTRRRLAVLKHLKPLAEAESNSVLYFGPTVRDAESMAYLLRREGITAAVISGETRDVTRRQVIRDFKKGQVRALCNCEVLTTGFDAPKVTHIVMARPTVSRVLYEQIVGRGLRGPRFGGTDKCVILDYNDHFKGTRPTLGYEQFRSVWKAAGSEA